MVYSKRFLLHFSLSLFTLLFGTTHGICPGNGGPPIPIHFGYMAAVAPNGSYVTGGTIPAVDIALERINNDSSLLDGYLLSYNGTVFDTKCSRSRALHEYFSMISTRPPYYLAVVGAGCSVATEPVAELTHYWSLPVVSYASSAPELSIREQFPSFFRIYPSDANFVPAFVGLMKGFGWKKVCIFTEEENLFLQNERPLSVQLAAAGISSNSFTFAPTSNIASMISDALTRHNDTHIFFINSYEGPGRAIMCRFYQLGYRYPAYSFITHGWYKDQWWQGSTECSDSDFMLQLNRVLAIQQYPFASNRTAPTYSGLSVNEFDSQYFARLANTPYNESIEAHNAYDAVYTLAIALDRVQRAVCANDTLGCDAGPLIHLEDFRYYNSQVECMLNKSLNMTGFNGVSGYVKFDENGTRRQDVFTIFQYQSTNWPNGSSTIRRQMIGVLDIMDNYTFRYSNSTSVWPEGVPPDGTIQRITNTIHTSVIAIFYFVAINGVLFAVVCLIFNFVFRNKKVIKLTSPNVNYVITIGALIMYLSVIFLLLPGLDVYSLNLRCSFGYWLAMVGYTISFSAVLAKMWRVYYIFHNPTPKKRTLKDWHLIMIVIVVTIIILFLLLIGEAIPMTRHIPTLVSDGEHPSERNELDVILTYFIYTCYDSTEGIAYQALILAFLLLLQVIGIVLAFQTRKVKVKVLNDAKQVTAIIYITSVCVVVIIMTTFALGSFLNASRTLFCLSICVATTAFLLLIFVPKMYSLYKDPDGKLIFTKSGGSTLPGAVGGDSSTLRKDSLGITIALATLGDDPKAQIATLEAKVIELQEELKMRQAASSDTKRPSLIPAFFKNNRTPSLVIEEGTPQSPQTPLPSSPPNKNTDSKQPTPLIEKRDNNNDVIVSNGVDVPAVNVKEPTLSDDDDEKKEKDNTKL